MKKVRYFLFPGWAERGSVYAVDEEAAGTNGVIQLPDGTLIQPAWQPDRFAHFDSSCQVESGSGSRYAAELMFTWDNMVREYQGDWEPLIKLVNAAAELNILFCVKLTAEEYQRLCDQEVQDEFLRLFSERAQSLIRIGEGSAIVFDHEGPALDLFRTGRCP